MEFCRTVNSLILAVLCFAGWGRPSVFADDEKTRQERFFVEQVRPIFETKCWSCHGPRQQKSGYRLDVRDVALSGGDSGQAPIAPGKSADSLLLKYVSSDDAGLAMPPRESQQPRLTESEIAAIRQWIERGAVWPESANARPTEPLDWWSFRPLLKPTKPTYDVHPVDAFVISKLAEKGLCLGPAADARTLARRLYFDLIGLPPEPEELDDFERAAGGNREAAVERLVDKLLASPRYGERWARHWLDVAHYGDSHGYDKDKPRPNAWPYRDYVVRAFNEDKPYPRFIEEQLAGDVLWPGTRDGVEALGFIASGPWDFIGHAELPETKIDGKIARHLDRDDMVSNTIGTFCSATVHCAQCHQHKFDPISQEDYYSLQAVFAAVDRTDVKYYPDAQVQRRWLDLQERSRANELALREIDRPLQQLAGDAYTALAKRIEDATKGSSKQADSQKSNSPKGNNPALPAGDTKEQLLRQRDELLERFSDEATIERRRALIAESIQLAARQGELPPPNLVYVGGVHHGSGNFLGTGGAGGKPRPVFLLARGQVTQPGAEVGPGALSAFAFRPSRFSLPENAGEGQRRASLARWISDPQNPLTWRSIVNRVWQYHFGRGIADTPNDLGRNGGLPTHPELLDWLAVEFRESGGSLKKLHKLIATSSTYGQSSASRPREEKIDSQNTLLWRQNRRRLEAEAIRDSVLSVSGALDNSMGGPGWRDFVVEHPEHSPHYEYGLADPSDGKTWRRSIYRFIVRSQTHPWMTSLDCADPSTRVDKRNESNSTIQALALLNNGFMLDQSKHFAERAQRECGDLDSRVERAYRLALGRSPSQTARRRLVAFAQQNGLPYLCRVLLNLNEFIFVD